MTPDQLRATGERLFGPRWQTALATSLGVAVRTVQRWLAKSHAIPEGAARDIAALDAHDEWIVGEGADTGRAFLIHNKFPRFIARAPAQEVDAQAAQYLREIIWIDKPTAAARHRLGSFRLITSIPIKGRKALQRAD